MEKRREAFLTCSRKGGSRLKGKGRIFFYFRIDSIDTTGGREKDVRITANRPTIHNTLVCSVLRRVLYSALACGLLLGIGAGALAGPPISLRLSELFTAVK